MVNCTVLYEHCDCNIAIVSVQRVYISESVKSSTCIPYM